MAALFGKVRVAQVSASEATRAATRFRTDWTTRFLIIELSATIALSAMDLAQKHGLRGYDSVQLAAALAVQNGRMMLQLPPLIFISADIGQLQAATAEGFKSTILMCIHEPCGGMMRGM